MKAERGPATWLEEDTLAQSAERYASMFTHHPHATYSVDPRGYFTDANARALEMTGLSLEQIRQTHFSQVIHADDLHVIQAAFQGAMSGEPQLSEARVVRDDGAVVEIRATAIPVVVDGEVVGVHGISEDITEAKRVVRELEAANAAKSLFLATVSHEVRTPLAVLVGATELLKDLDLDPEPEHYADMVHRSGQGLMRLVDDILEFSGLEADQTVLHPRPFDVRQLLEDLAGWAVPSAERRGLEISFDVDDAVPATLVGDCRRISQVVTNLVHNAIKFTERGSVHVRVGCPAVGPEGPDTDVRVELSVADTGIGIAEEHLPSLFEAFTQVDPHAAGDRQGFGLGLAISRLLVDLMGGRLEVSSTLGAGSTFAFTVPLGRVSPESASCSGEG